MFLDFAINVMHGGLISLTFKTHRHVTVEPFIIGLSFASNFPNQPPATL